MSALNGKRRLHPRRGPQPIARVLDWYFRHTDAGPARLPFYCDPQSVGAFAVPSDELAAGKDTAIFKLFVSLSMYQAFRDVVIMRHQRALPRAAMRVVADVNLVKRSIAQHKCPAFRSNEAFEQECAVAKIDEAVDCRRCPGTRCHVKDATVVFNRMGDMGKLPSSAWLRLWQYGGVQRLLDDTCILEASPTKRASLLVQSFARVHRVGRKLATLFVSTLSTPALAPGLTPWFPRINGNELVVVDTNVARAIDTLSAGRVPKTYDRREMWVRERAAQFDLRTFRTDLPKYSPRIVQQALYVFGSKAGRLARGDACAGRHRPCEHCVPTLCPFL